ncbi:MAG: transcription antitermination factor NusB [Candidatus Omnitrophica bacterium]|nr:transcription antitermination factor NusB [Candidatus Omnitrophota bacterium]MCM8808688.1 transcription antitermination factor NusB [Candidatus Omnitrophota bacterium]MCM8810329.1 transcription antitermination factor NusB [Candidatus Omnitrophota bacterium]MCM8833025.1 transcription antitermination factor NusB [Candidatus Omnitrophota bacterium]
MIRRRGREVALKILYKIDMTGEDNIEITEENKTIFFENLEQNEKVKTFAKEIIEGVIKNIKEIDEIISKVSLNWDIKRMSYIDRNILRIGTYEIVFRKDIPSVVSINEAIEISKKYGDKDSSKFINGILHKIKELYRNSEKVDENET